MDKKKIIGVVKVPILMAALTLIEILVYEAYKKLRKTGCHLDV